MRKIQSQLPDGPAILALKPGIKTPDTANDLIYSATRNIQVKRVFVAGPGSISSALWAGRNGAAVATWGDNTNWSACLKETFSLAGIPEPRIHLQAGFENIDTGLCDLALIHLPRGKSLQLEILQLAAAVLREGGKLVFVGAKKEGVKTALKFARDIFHQAGIIAHKGGYHAGLAQRPSGDYPLPRLLFNNYKIVLDDLPTSLVSCPGVFASGRLDGGAKALIDSMVIDSYTKVLDMGCGAGLVGLSALRKGADVTLTDVSLRAVVSSRKTLLANGFDGKVIHTSGAENCANAEFDTVYCNPPFHKGHGVDFETTRYLLDEAERVLMPGGSLYLVANTFLKYGPWIQENFINVQVFYENSRFRVWKGSKS